MAEYLKNKPIALRHCLLYVFLQKSSTEKAFAEFCGVIGKEVIKKEGLEFWFDKFKNGIFDIEKDKKTAQSLRLFSRNQKVFHGELTFNADWDSIYIKFGARDLIRYKNDRDDCEIEFRNRKKVLRGVSCLKQALQDFKKILENPKLYLRTLAISFSYWHTDVGSIEEHIEDALKLTHLLHVQHLSLCTRSMKALLNILPSLKPGYLTTIVSDAININADEAAIKELVKMDQWKQAKCLLMSCYLFDGPLRHLYHFKEFAVFREELYIDDVREMKEILLKSLDFERCNLRFHDSDDPIAIRQVFGGPIEGSIDTCHYPIPNSTEYFEIIVGSEAIKIERKKK
ncbi:hypothetical protein CAEBREN_05911 [Caenorhabditis brenneri]|uniref:Mos1 transposase HTH domain-containing protein n=1 Tax=Caenorhabditis brenneri TaxID=135651 RepID=G0NIE4_CAEBE|nr:hypothetical protein CAEBREN_05911 [Caenorhabditis brenneri]